MDNFLSATSYSTSTVTILVGFTLNEWAAVVGIIGVVATYATNLYFKIRKSKSK